MNFLSIGSPKTQPMKLSQDKISQIILGRTKLKKLKKNNRFLSSKLNMKCSTTILKRREKIKKSDTTNEIYINFIKSKKKTKST